MRALALPSLVLLGVALGGASVGCVDVPERDPSQWPIARTEIEQALPVADATELTYRQRCVACHGVDGRGGGARTGADFTAAEGPLTKPDDELAHSIREGRRGAIGAMPPHGAILTDDEIASLVGYLRRTFGPDIAIATPDAGVDVEAGAEPSGAPEASGAATPETSGAAPASE